MQIIVNIPDKYADGIHTASLHISRMMLETAESAGTSEAREFALSRAQLYGAISEGIEKARTADGNLKLMMEQHLKPYVQKYGLESVRDMVMAYLQDSSALAEATSHV